MPPSAEAHNDLGAILLRKGQVDEAIGQFQKALQCQPGLAGAHRSLAGAFLAKGAGGRRHRAVCRVAAGQP